jgi:phosphoserine aminotransferase
MAKRVYNFSPGPAVLPVPAMEEAQRDLLALPGAGASILEISHRSKAFTEIIEQAEANMRCLLAIPDDYHVLFLQGGARMQFAMVPMNLLPAKSAPGDYILTGSWGKHAIKEAKTQGEVRVAWDGDSVEYRRVPEPNELELDPDAAYCHITSNETIQGVQLASEPDVGDVPLVCDASSDILCRPVPVRRYGILYACAQKNVGPAGVTVVVIRDDLLERSPDALPSMLNYRKLAEAKSRLNTPPTFAVYVVKLVTGWLLNEIGGLEKMHQLNQQKAKLLYDVLDRSAGFYRGHAEPASRSIMNVTFRLPNETLEKQFLEQAEARDLAALKGHRSVGGCRASIYNAMPIEGVRALRDFMLEFRDQHAGT